MGRGGDGKRKEKAKTMTELGGGDTLTHQKVPQCQLVLDLVLPMFGHLGDQQDIGKLGHTKWNIRIIYCCELRHTMAVK